MGCGASLARPGYVGCAALAARRVRVASSLWVVRGRWRQDEDVLRRSGANEVEEQADVRLLEFLVDGVVGCGGHDWASFKQGPCHLRAGGQPRGLGSMREDVSQEPV